MASKKRSCFDKLLSVVAVAFSFTAKWTTKRNPEACNDPECAACYPDGHPRRELVVELESDGDGALGYDIRAWRNSKSNSPIMVAVGCQERSLAVWRRGLKKALNSEFPLADNPLRPLSRKEVADMLDTELCLYPADVREDFTNYNQEMFVKWPKSVTEKMVDVLLPRLEKVRKDHPDVYAIEEYVNHARIHLTAPLILDAIEKAFADDDVKEPAPKKAKKKAKK